MRPVDLAKAFGISSNTLRNYEARGAIPPAERTASGYRVYREEHAAYLRCLQALAPGFGPDVAAEALRRVRSGDAQGAFWLLKGREAALFRDRKRAEEAFETFRAQAGGAGGEAAGKRTFTIGEAAELAGVAPSAIRYWEKEGLLRPDRREANGYRTYSRSEVWLMACIRALRSLVYSVDTVRLRRAVAALRADEPDRIGRLAEEVMAHLDRMNAAQARGVHALYGLCRRLKLVEGGEEG